MALGGLEVVRLGRADAAQPRTAAHDVDQDDRQLRARHVAHRLGHQADTRTRRRHEHASPGRRGTEGHVDRAELALGLHEHATALRHPPRHPLEERRRGHGLGVGLLQAGLDGGLGDRLVALHEHGRRSDWSVDHHRSLGRANTLNTASGQIRAHSAQLVQAPPSVSRTG